MQRSLQQTIAVQALLCKSNEEKRFCFFKSRALTRKKKKKSILWREVKKSASKNREDRPRTQIQRDMETRIRVWVHQ